MTSASLHIAILVPAVANLPTGRQGASQNTKQRTQMEYKIEDINIGDEVIFDSTNLQSNKDLYWTVIGKSDSRLMIELKEMGFDENWTIAVNEVRGHIPLNKKKN